MGKLIIDFQSNPICERLMPTFGSHLFAHSVSGGECVLGDELSVDHIIPRIVVPELDNVIANLELMPLRINSRKNSTVGSRQIDLAQKLFKAGLLSESGLKTVRSRRS